MMLRFTLVIAIAILSVACGLGPDLSKDRVPRSPTPTPFIPDKPIADYIRDGSAAYAAGNFSEAAVHYKKAFEIEQREQKLEKKERREMIANAATTFGRTGDTKTAKLAIAYGLSKDFDAPMYHYALGCIYANEGDESTTLYHLRAAFGFRHRLLKGEKMSDPMTDSCFADFAESDSFKRSVAEMKRSPLRDQD